MDRMSRSLGRGGVVVDLLSSLQPYTESNGSSPALQASLYVTTSVVSWLGSYLNLGTKFSNTVQRISLSNLPIVIAQGFIHC